MKHLKTMESFLNEDLNDKRNKLNYNKEKVDFISSIVTLTSSVADLFPNLSKMFKKNRFNSKEYYKVINETLDRIEELEFYKLSTDSMSDINKADELISEIEESLIDKLEMGNEDAESLKAYFLERRQNINNKITSSKFKKLKKLKKS